MKNGPQRKGSRAIFEALETRVLFSSYTIAEAANVKDPNIFDNPSGGQIAIDSSGDIFGTNLGSQPTNEGEIWEVAPGQTQATAIASFPANEAYGIGVQPSGLQIDSQGNLFGMLDHGVNPNNGDYGGMWELPYLGNGAYAATPTIVAAFDGNTGATPGFGVYIDPATGDIFGTADALVGAPANITGNNTIWEWKPGDTAFTLLATFDATARPASSVVMDSGGNLWTTTETDSTSSGGSLWELPASGAGFSSTLTHVASFSSPVGQTPQGQLAIDAADNIFGDTIGTFSVTGGGDAQGSVWGYNASSQSLVGLGVFTNYAQGDSASMNTGVLISGGNLYGATSGTGDGTGLANIWEIADYASSDTPTLAADFSTLPTDIMYSSPDSSLVADGSGNIFGVSSVLFELTAGDSGGGGGGGGGGSGGGDSSGIGTVSTGLTPAITASTIPTAVVAGAKLHATVKVNVTDSLGTVESGITARVYASTDTTLDPTTDTLITQLTKPTKIKAGKTAPLTIPITTLPPDLSSDTYYIFVETVDSAGTASAVSAPTPITIAAPFTALSETVTTTLPAALVSGAAVHGTVTLILTNNGNVASKGMTSFDVTASTTAGVAGTSIAPLSKNVTVLPGKTARVVIPVKGLPALASDNYYLVAQVSDPNGNITSGTLAGTITIAAPFVNLGVAFSAIPRNVLAQGATLSITNSGNVDDTGAFTATIGFSSDNAGANIIATGPAIVSPAKVVVKSGKTAKLHVTGWDAIFKTITAGDYFLTVTVTDSNGNSASTVSTGEI